MTVQLALYRGPKGPTATWINHLAHWAIRLRTLSRHSHAELVIDGKCYSSSVRDKGVRAKYIDLRTDKWDVFDLPNADKQYALNWFETNKDAKYDDRGIVSWIIPFIKHDPNKYVCFEAVGCMLGIPKSHRLTGNKLKDYALQNNLGA